MDIVLGDLVRHDENYLREDEAKIMDFVEGKIPLLPVCAPRRFGKTSYLEKIRRRVNEKDCGKCIYMSLDNGKEEFKKLKDIFSELNDDCSNLVQCLKTLTTDVFFSINSRKSLKELLYDRRALSDQPFIVIQSEN